MITDLRIKDFAIIDSLSLSLSAGLNVLSGETGAGKSIVVGALGLLLGERAQSDSVRSGCERAVVEGSFDAAAVPGALSLLREQGLAGDDTTVVLRREVHVAGRGRAWVNGFAVSVSTLAELGRMLASIHGQHEAQDLLDSRAQRELLDDYAGAAVLRESAGDLFRRLAAADRDFALAVEQRGELDRRAAEMREIVRELSSAGLLAGEEEQLDEEANRLGHAVELRRLATEGHELMSAEDSGAVDAMARVRRNIDALMRIDPRASGMAETVNSAEVVLAELARELGDYAARVEVDPDRLAQVNERRTVLFRLTRKYSETTAGLVTLLQSAESELAVSGSSEEKLERLHADRSATQLQLAVVAKQLTAAREAAATELSALISVLLPGLGMESGRLNVCVTAATLDASGADDVSFRVQLNVGHEERELTRVASGGELSRIMLAIKTVLADADKVPCLIFDEVDAGIGGETALRVGDALRALARHHQILVITHLPQIAARAHNHLIVRKQERNGTATAIVEPVEGGARVAEIARMLSGDPSSSSGRRHAKELLAAATQPPA